MQQKKGKGCSYLKLGILGSIFTGIFANEFGLVYSKSFFQLGRQLIAILIVTAISATVTFIILFPLRLLGRHNSRLFPLEKKDTVDISRYGMDAYDWEDPIKEIEDIQIQDRSLTNENESRPLLIKRTKDLVL